MYKRILVYISGTELKGEFESGIDHARITELAAKIDEITKSDLQIVVVVGSSNYVNQDQHLEQSLKRNTVHGIRTLSTVINALAVRDIFESQNIPVRCHTNMYSEQVAQSYMLELAEKDLASKRVVIIGGGNGVPEVSSDRVAAGIALELDCEAVVRFDNSEDIEESALRLADEYRLPYISFTEVIALGKQEDVRVAIQQSKYQHAVIGGTMDAFHVGHQLYIDYALRIAGRLTIYINHEDFVQSNKSYEVKPWNIRAEVVKKYLKKHHSLQRCDIVKTKSIDDIKSLYVRPDIDAAIVADDRRSFPEEINRVRSVPLAIIAKSRALDAAGNDISSTAINASP